MRMMMTSLHPATTSSSQYATTAPAGQPMKSPWHSPVPYLFGGLAAMLGLIAFALLILACSYWKLSRDDTQQQQSNNNDNNERRDLEKGDDLCKVNGVPLFEEKIVVIMAGNDKPTFLAKPALMLINSNNKCHDDDDDSNDDHVLVGGNIAKDDEQAKESSSVDDHNDDDHHDDDDEPKEDESTTTHHPHTSN